MNRTQSILKNPGTTIQILKIFFIVGLAGILIPATSPYFTPLTPLALILSFGLVLLFHSKFDTNTIFVFVAVGVVGYLLEAVGVNTGLIFGNYSYGETLGFKTYNTPLIIGLNWLLMTYITSSSVEIFNIPAWLKVLAASGLMVIYDLVLEQVAPKMDMWSWQNDTIPFQNYVTWFIVALIFQSIFKIRKIDTYNPVAISVLIIQFVFFVILFLFK